MHYFGQRFVENFLQKKYEKSCICTKKVLFLYGNSVHQPTTAMQVSFHLPELVVIRVAIPSGNELPLFAKISDRPAYIPQSVKAIFLNMKTAHNRWYHILTDWPGAVSENSVQIWANEFYRQAGQVEAF